jgi:hypothetical protein
VTKKQAKSRLVRNLNEDGKDFPILGYMCWWSIRNVDITQEQFAEMLTDVGLDDSYAREHNYMSAFKRALKMMEEKRIIRVVEDDATKMLCQFTAERKVKGNGSDEGPSLEYDKETILRIDKNAYRKEKDFAKALSQGDEAIREKVVEHFYREKVRYNSNDITRYVQKILRDRGDILPLRDQGNIYFVPSEYADLLEKVQKLVRRIAGGKVDSFESVPMPDVKASRTLVGNNLTSQVEGDYAKLLADVQALSEGKLGEVTETWKSTRLNRIKKLQKRLETYTEVLGEDGVKLVAEAEKLEKEVMKYRKLDLED